MTRALEMLKPASHSRAELHILFLSGGVFMAREKEERGDSEAYIFAVGKTFLGRCEVGQR